MGSRVDNRNGKGHQSLIHSRWYGLALQPNPVTLIYKVLASDCDSVRVSINRQSSFDG